MHLVRDVGAAYLTSGIASVWAARTPAWRVPLAASAALFLGLHGLIHVFEVAAGVQPPVHLLEDPLLLPLAQGEEAERGRAAPVHDVVRRVEDASGVETVRVPGLPELGVGGAGDDPTGEAGNRLPVQDAADRARRVDVAGAVGDLSRREKPRASVVEGGRLLQLLDRREVVLDPDRRLRPRKVLLDRDAGRG